jgi:acyl carrier protein
MRADDRPAATCSPIIAGMERREIEETIRTIIRKERDVPDSELDLATPLAAAGIDSLDALNILFGIEETFGIAVSDEQARSIRSLGDMVDTVESLLTARNSA